MFATTVLSLALVAQTGPIPERRVITTEVVTCDDCGVRLSAVDVGAFEPLPGESGRVQHDDAWLTLTVVDEQAA